MVQSSNPLSSSVRWLQMSPPSCFGSRNTRERHIWLQYRKHDGSLRVRLIPRMEPGGTWESSALGGDITYFVDCVDKSGRHRGWRL